MPSTPIPSVLREDVLSGHDEIENLAEPTSSRISVGMSNLGTEGKSVPNKAEGRTRSRRGVSQVSYKEPALGKKLRQVMIVEIILMVVITSYFTGRCGKYKCVQRL